ncbi:MAG: hypothetical protein JNM17_00795 [Archangium sp.]|nr:hypothetical protein [Archangium sp.]
MNALLRVQSVFAVWALCVMLNGCSCSSAPCDATREGFEGGCCDMAGLCEGTTGLVCTEAVCRACGTEGVQCCMAPGEVTPSCNAGLTCVAPAMGAQLCQRCGAEGGPCCEGDGTATCAAGLSCLAHVCVSSATACMVAPGVATRPINVGVVDQYQCGLRVITVMSDTFEHAKECAGSMLAPNELVRAVEIGDVTEPTRYPMCVDIRRMGRHYAEPRAFSLGDANLCVCGENGPIGCIRMPTTAGDTCAAM